MTNLGKGLLVASVAAFGFGLATAQHASAQVIESPTTSPLEFSAVFTEPPITQSAVVSAPLVINNGPIFWPDIDLMRGRLLNVPIPRRHDFTGMF